MSANKPKVGKFDQANHRSASTLSITDDGAIAKHEPAAGDCRKITRSFYLNA